MADRPISGFSPIAVTALNDNDLLPITRTDAGATDAGNRAFTWLSLKSYIESAGGVKTVASVGGTANAITGNIGIPFNDGTMIVLTAANNNTGATTITLDGGTSRSVVDARGNALGSGRIVSGSTYILQRVGASVRLLTEAVTAADLQGVYNAAMSRAVHPTSSVANVGNAYTATAAAPFEDIDGVYILFNPSANNSAGPTLAINGGSTRQIRDQLGASFTTPDKLTAGRIYLLRRVGAQWWIVFEGVTVAEVVSKAEASALSTEINNRTNADLALTGRIDLTQTHVEGVKRLAVAEAVEASLGRPLSQAVSNIYAGDASDITVSGILSKGTEAFSFGFVGTGSDPVKTNDGIQFVGGRFFRWSGALPATVRKMIVFAEITRDGNPSSSSGTIFQFAASGTSRAVVRYTSTLFQMSEPSAIYNTMAMGTNGDRFMVGFEVDYENGTWAVMEPDGYYAEGTHSGATAGTTGTLDIGQNCNITLHALGVAFAYTGGPDIPVTLREIAQRYLEKDYPKQVEYYEFARNNGQSNSLGQNDAPTRAFLSNTPGAREMVKMVTGLQSSTPAAVYLHGPAGASYNTGVAGTGLIPAYAQANITTGYPFAIALQRRRFSERLPNPKFITGFNGRAGQAINQFGDGTSIFANWEYWQSEAIRLADAIPVTPGYYGWIQGEADRDLAQGAYLTAARQVLREIWDLDIEQLGVPPVLLMYQIGGSADSVGHNYYCKTEQIDLCDEFGGIFVTTLDRFPLINDGVHLKPQSTLLVADTSAWAVTEVEAGRGWSTLRPEIVSNSGGVLTLRFPTRKDEVIVIDEEIYTGARPSNYGFQLVGGTLSSVEVFGATVRILYSGSPTGLLYALQSASISPVDGGYSVHRGELRSSLTKESVLVSGETLYRWVPSFRFDSL